MRTRTRMGWSGMALCAQPNVFTRSCSKTSRPVEQQLGGGMINMVKATSPWRSPVPRGIYGGELSLAGDRDGEDRHQSVHIAGSEH